VPRQTRTQRRARREAREASGGGAPPAAPPLSPPDTPGPSPGPSGRDRPAAVPEEHHRGGPRLIRFIREASAELKKVEWPSQSQVVTGTTVVLIACFIVGVFLYVNDEVWKRFVEHFILK
jgi:preprotein translocase SecE subunit